MSWNRSGGNWTELKGKAKKQLDKFKDFESDEFVDNTQHHKKNHDSRKNTKHQADVHQSNLHALLHNMKSYNAAHSEILKADNDDND